MKVGNNELMTPRDLRRALTPSLERITTGEIEKLVLTQGGKLRFVVISAEEYERLSASDRERQ